MSITKTISGSLFQMLPFASIDGPGISTVSSFLDIQVYRDNDVVEGDVLVKEFDIHFQIDQLGSEQEFAK